MLRSREVAQKAKEVGGKDVMMDLTLRAVSAEGKHSVSFSKDQAANDVARALEAYRAAEALDPSLYEAPLFIGDCYFILKRPDDKLMIHTDAASDLRKVAGQTASTKPEEGLQRARR